MSKKGGRMDVDDAARADWRVRWSNALDRVEAVYLKILRALVLLVATGLIAFAGWLGITGLMKISRSPDSVVEKEAKVSADDLGNAPLIDEPTRPVTMSPTSTGESSRSIASATTLPTKFSACTRWNPLKV